MNYARMLRNACVAVVVAILASTVIVGSAFADDVTEGDFSSSGPYEVVYGPTVLSAANQQFGVICYAENSFDAALLALGYSLGDTDLTAERRAYLSNESTGGSFYEFANGFTNQNDYEAAFTSTAISFSSALRTSNSIYGSEYVWARAYTETLYNAAKQRIIDIIEGDVGGSGGGSGGSVIEDDKYVFTVPVCFVNDIQDSRQAISFKYSGLNYGNQLNYVGNGSGSSWANIILLSSSTVTVKIPVSWFSGLSGDEQLAIKIGGFSNATPNFQFCKIDSNSSVTKTTQTHTATYNNDTRTTEFNLLTGTGVQMSNVLNLGSRFTYYPLTNTFDYSGSYSSISFGSTTTVPSEWSQVTSSTLPKAGYIGYSANEVTVPPNNWPEPDPPITTEPPEVPEPDPPSGSNQTEISVQFPNITFPSITLSPDFTWVTADIDAILRSLNSHCQHLQEAIHNGFDDFFEDWEIVVNRNFGRVIQAIQTNFGWIWDNVQDEFDYLYDYLYDLFHWLARQFDYNGSSGYNDDTVVSWLKKIYSKLGSGPVNTRPVDPVADPFNFGEWLNQLMQNLVLNLLALGQDVLANLVESARQLITKFPFSIPWDIAAIIAALAAEPVTPVLVVPAYTVTGSGLTQAGSYRLDLAQYDSVMVGVRAMETVVFGIYLMFKTDFFLGIMKLSGGKD